MLNIYSHVIRKTPYIVESLIIAVFRIDIVYK